MAQTAVICSHCGARSPSVSLWMSHLRQVHQLLDHFTVSCPVNGCGAMYSNVNSMCSHIYRKHRNLLCSHEAGRTTTTANIVQESSLYTNLTEYSFDPSITESINHDISQLLHTDEFEQKKKSILFLMHLKEERLMTQAAVNDVVSGMKEVCEHSMGRLKAGVSRTLSKAGIDMEKVDGLSDIFKDVSHPFKGLESAYLQDKFITQELECIVSYVELNNVII